MQSKSQRKVKYMKKILKKILNKLMKKSNVDIAKELGVSIGKDCLIYADPYLCFGSEPYLVEIGDHVEITGGCRLITHDGAVWTLRTQPELANIDKFGKITIGNNVFIGMNSTVLPGVTIGDNCIVGACSLVTKDIPSGEVWGGVPAHYISTLCEYRDKAVLKADYTKGLSSAEKEKAIKANHSEWFKSKA